jgi:Zn-dependent protease with chaperone function
METVKQFPGISPRSWEHPADRAALGAFKAIPGADVIVKNVVGLTSEKSMRLMMLASAARVRGHQYERVGKAASEAAAVFGLEECPEIYVSQNPFFNAGAYGVDKPFIVLNSSLLDLLDETEIKSVIGHEIGHVLSGHALYKTILWFLLKVSANATAQLPLAGLAVGAVIVALNEWDRKSELSADRAGLLATQDGVSSYTSLMKSAGGRNASEMDINEFFAQAAEYDAAGDALGSLYKLLNTLGQSHPFPVTRLSELKTWEKTGYEEILRGNYLRRGQEGADMGSDFAKAGAQYKADFSQSRDPLSNLAGNMANGAEELFKNADKTRQQVSDFLTGLLNGGK